MRIAAILPAAGLGTRMGSEMPKQFLELSGLPLVVFTLRRLAECSALTHFYIATLPEEVAGLERRLGQEKLGRPVRVLRGGATRQESVARALAEVPADADLVLVHDAVRPLVTGEIIHEVIDAAKKYGAAIAGLPAVDTVKQVERTAEGAIVKGTIPRAGVVLAQTPQGFRYSVIKKAFDEAAADGFMGTDEASLAERAGHEVAVVMGSAKNIKITTPGDMELAEFYLRK